MNSQNKYSDCKFITIKVKKKNLNEILNCYASLNYDIVNQKEGIKYSTITLKQDKSLKNLNLLNRLQVRIEDKINKIDELECSKKHEPTIISIIIGTISSLIFGGGMSLAMFNFEPLNIPLVAIGICLGVVGGALATLVYPLYTKMVAKRTNTATSVIEMSKEELSDLCKAANKTVETSLD